MEFFSASLIKMRFLKPNKNFLAFLFAMLFLTIPIIPPLSFVAISLIIITWFATYNNEEYKILFKSNIVLWVLAALYFIVIIGLIYTSSNWNDESIQLKKYLKFLLIIQITLLLANDVRLQKIAFNSFCISMLFILLSTWLNIWFLLPWSKSQNLGWGASHHVFGDYIIQNIMMSFFTVISFNKAIKATNYKYRIYWGAIGILALVSITHLSHGRGGFVMLTVGLFTYVLLAFRAKWLAISAISIVIVLGVAIGTSDSLQGRISRGIEEAKNHEVNHRTSIGHRLFNYKTTINLIKEKPIFGHGTGAYHTEICRFFKGNDQDLCDVYRQHPHNQFLLIGADHGLIGMVLYAFFIFSLYYTGFRSTNSTAKVLLCTLTSMLLFDSLMNSSFYSSRQSLFFACMIALLVSMCISKPLEER